ncbi:MAG: VCBS repeat-containing protein, partial [Acidobacteria bacterium]|nr:VCBS repeat-containing protein [Acidobacteriota bacterium]
MSPITAYPVSLHRRVAAAGRRLALLPLALSLVSLPAAAQRLAFAASETYALTDTPQDVIIEDFDGDGIPDIAVLTSSLTAGSVSVLLGNDVAGVPDGTFAAPVESPSQANAGSLAAGHFNADSSLDLVVAYQGSNVSVLLGAGDGSFGAGADYGTGGSGPGKIAVADFNEDGILDLAVPNTPSNNVGILLGQGSGGMGDGTFAAAVTYATGAAPRAVAVADLDEDGILDLATVNSTGLNVSVLLGNGSGGVGDGTFASAVSYATGAAGLALVTADFDGDDITDLALQDSGNRLILVLLGQGSGGVGDGTFGAPISSPTNLTPRDLAVGDFDGDGLTDLVLVNASNGFSSVHLAVGDGTFEAPRLYQVDRVDATSFPVAVAAADLDGDGAPDFVTGNFSNSNVSVLRNLGEAPAAGFLRLTELMIDPDQVADVDGEYFELYNAAAFPIHLLNWTFEDSNGFRGFLNGAIGPGELFVVGASADLDGAGFAPDLVPITFPGFGNTADRLTVRDSSGEIFAELAWSDGN